MSTRQRVPVPLTALSAGTHCTFHEARLDAASSRLLRALGLTSACRLRLCKNGEPCIVQVRATRIGLSKKVAGSIFVIPDSHAA
jgi:Fe2+ transport system protein FeoA